MAVLLGLVLIGLLAFLIGLLAFLIGMALCFELLRRRGHLVQPSRSEVLRVIEDMLDQQL